MNTTNIVTCFLTHGGKYLILKRSDRVKSMRNVWAGISGIIEGGEDPLYRAKTEILEEAGVTEERIKLLKTGPEMRVESQYANHEWLIYPFLFSLDRPSIALNWENNDYAWIAPPELPSYQTVPSLSRVLASLL